MDILRNRQGKTLDPLFCPRVNRKDDRQRNGRDGLKDVFEAHGIIGVCLAVQSKKYVGIFPDR